jgi:DNA polymerase IV
MHHRHISPTLLTRPPHLLHETTSEHERLDGLPPIPDFLHTTYSCQRPTTAHSLNDPFIFQLKEIKLSRILTGDEIGVRAYSTAIATLAAYPHKLTSVQEVLGLPGCDQKIALLYQEWKETGHIEAVDDIKQDSKLRVLNLFYEIWGVGAVTAREFYNKGWRDLDDVVEHGWQSLSRVQQIGVKYYEEFQQKIPRSEVEAIGNIILEHANKLHKGFQMVIVGGYRRGKSQSGDVDVILTHPNENFTNGFIQDIVQALEESKWITHTLTLSLANSERGQTPVSWKGEVDKRRSGFDTLDKALVVWQDPSWPSKAPPDAGKGQGASSSSTPTPSRDTTPTNPNIHRRVDIIISPWKTAGCAILGWTSGTTFQRDMRRYARTRGLKFDSSGIRSREDGRWVDFERKGGNDDNKDSEDAASDLLEKEKRVFEGLGLVWREPWERCTG